MGNTNSATDLVDTSILPQENIFKVDNINSYGRKHSSAKIQILDDNLCIQQKHRQSLHIPLDAIKRYGLDGSIFILECGHRAPLGQARYAFRCKQAQHLVDCLDQRISIISNQLLEEQQEISSLTLTNVSSRFNQRQRTQSDHDRILSSMSLSSATSFYRNSEPDLSENYFAFERFPNQRENEEQFIPIEMHYAEFNAKPKESNSSLDTSITIESGTESPVQQQRPRKRALLSHFHHQPKSTNRNETTSTLETVPESSSNTKSYMYIDHEKTTTLKDIAQQRLQQYPQRIQT